jgi:hypothetical protein
VRPNEKARDLPVATHKSNPDLVAEFDYLSFLETSGNAIFISWQVRFVTGMGVCFRWPKTWHVRRDGYSRSSVVFRTGASCRQVSMYSSGMVEFLMSDVLMSMFLPARKTLFGKVGTI